MFLQRGQAELLAIHYNRLQYGLCIPGIMPKSSFRDLRVWGESMDLAIEIYRASASFPAGERFVLTAQLRRAAISIPSNIAEGARRTRRPFVLHLEVALGSQAEVEVQLELAHRLGFMTATEHAALQQRAVIVGRMLHRLVESLRPPKSG